MTSIVIATQLDTANQTQFLNGTNVGLDSFEIDGNSADYRYDLTLDGQGIVVWNVETGSHDILYDFDLITFNDEVISFKDGQFVVGGPDVPPPPTAPDFPIVANAVKSIADIAGQTQHVQGSDAQDTFAINGNAADFGFDQTLDGNGIVVWNVATGSHDILYNVEALQFNDTTFEYINGEFVPCDDHAAPQPEPQPQPEPEPQKVDLAIDKQFENVVSANGREGFVNGAYSFDLVKFTVSVTNNSDTAATGVVVRDEISENLDVWKPGDDLVRSETGQLWASNYWSSYGGSPFRGSVELVDSTQGTVNIIESEGGGAGQRLRDQSHGLDEGSLVWELGRAIEAGETVTLEYYGMRDSKWAYEGSRGTGFETEVQIVEIDQEDTDLNNNTDWAAVRWISPIALDLNGDGEIGVTGVTTSAQKDSNAEIGRTVEFDLDADGELDTIEWFDGSGDGILVDITKIGPNGEVDGSALFGDEGGKFANGYNKLAQHDANNDGTISGAELDTLGLWIDDGDAVLEAGELQSAAEAGVTSVSAEFGIVRDTEGRAVIRSEAEVNGETVLTEDVFFAEADVTDIMVENFNEDPAMFEEVAAVL